jgi:hypothetical protein
MMDQQRGSPFHQQPLFLNTSLKSKGAFLAQSWYWCLRAFFNIAAIAIRTRFLSVLQTLHPQNI